MARIKTTIYSKVLRVHLSNRDSDLLEFFKSLDALPADRRNETLLSAIRGGAKAATVEMSAHRNSAKADRAIDDILGAFD